ncbi:MAG: S41 family peptidase [Atopostipes suicloacalis]|nr:S41 family peptidase [Atopostipes suicloacalis]
MSENKKDTEKNKIKLTKMRYFLTLLIALVFGAGGMYGINYFIQEEQSISKGSQAETNLPLNNQTLFSDSDEFTELKKMFTILKSSYYEEIDSDILIEGALKGMSQSIGDPYTQYLNEEQAESLEEDISGSFEGIGAEVMKEGEYVRIISPIANSPAEAAGIQPNDLIIKVAGESVADLSINESVALIRGPKGSEVDLLIKRGGEEFTLTLTRDTIPVETVFYEQDEENPSIGYVNIVNFNSPTYDETVEAIKALRKDGVEKIIFDVRGNPGGLLTSAIEISNIFVEDGKNIMMTEYRGDEKPSKYLASDEYGDFKYEGDAILLVDEGSASASEILAGAMQSAGVPIYGQSTFGKGTIQSITDISDTEEIKLTVGKWLTAEGEWINEEGIQPDKKVSLPEYTKLFVVNTSESFEEGEASPEVSNLKSVLKALGYELTTNDLYDQSVITAISSLQEEKDLAVDGEVDAETARAITEALRDKIDQNDSQYKKAVEDIK